MVTDPTKDTTNQGHVWDENVEVFQIRQDFLNYINIDTVKAKMARGLSMAIYIYLVKGNNGSSLYMN